MAVFLGELGLDGLRRHRLAAAKRGRAFDTLGQSLGTNEGFVIVAADEGFHAVEGDVVVDLDRGALLEVRRRRDERALQTAIEPELETAKRIDDDAGAVGAVPDLELHLALERHVAERRALHDDVAVLAVEQPRHVVARADVDVVGIDVVVEHRCDRVGLGDLLGLEPLTLEHVQEVRVAPEVELIGAVEADAAVHEEAGQDAVADRGADLALDVVADHRQTLLGEAPLPVGLTGDEDRNAVHNADAGGEGLLHVPLRRLFRADWKVVDHDVDLAFAHDPGYVGRRAGRLLDDLGEVLAQTVVGHAAINLDAEVRDLLEDDGVVRLRIDRFGEVLADLVLVDVVCGHELDVAAGVLAHFAPCTSMRSSVRKPVVVPQQWAFI